MALARKLDVHHSTVTNWIARKQIDFVTLEGALSQKRLVDQRTAPRVRPVGRPKKSRLTPQPKNS